METIVILFHSYAAHTVHSHAVRRQHADSFLLRRYLHATIHVYKPLHPTVLHPKVAIKEASE